MTARMNTWAAAALTAVLACVAHADLTLGGSKSAGMGGAGLALGRDPLGPGARNPAWYGLNPRSYITWPQFRYSLTGIGIGDLDEFFKPGGGKVLDDDNLSKIARDFGNRKVETGMSLGIGTQFGAIAFDVRGEGYAVTDPNQPLKDWSNAGASLANVPADAALDGYGLGTIDVGVGAGQAFSYGKDKAAVGARLKYTRSYYSHWTVNQNNIINGGSDKAPEMNGDDVLEKAGLGLDAGLLWSSSHVPGLTGAMMINNLLVPNVTFDATRPDAGGTEALHPFRRSLDLGMAFDKGPWIAALDIIDVAGGSRRDLRLGGEVHAGRWLAVRAGWASSQGPTIGVGLAGFNIAYGRDFPVQAGYAIRF